VGTEPDSGGHANDGSDADDARDLIVRTMSAPGWLRRIPTAVWVVIAFVAFDVAYQVWAHRTSDLSSISPRTLLSLGAAVVGGAATVLLPAAVMVGCKDLGRSRSWLLQGAIALAAAELIGLVGRDVLEAIGWPSPSESPMDDFIFRLLVVQVPVLLLQAFGVVRIGLGLGSIAAPSRRVAWPWIVAVVGSFAALLVVDVRTVTGFSTTAGESSTLLVAYDAFVMVGNAILLGLWAWIVTIGARRRGPPWTWIAVAGLLVILGSAGWSLGTIVAVQVGGDNAVEILNWFALAGTVSSALGVFLLALAFAHGFTPDESPVEAIQETDALLV
jgi:hypothetical protein